MTVSTGTLNEKLKSNSLYTDAPPSLTPLRKNRGGRRLLFPDFFSEGSGGGERLYAGKNQTTIG